MDLTYRAHGDNPARLRMIYQAMGPSADVMMLENPSSIIFSIWCSDSPPPENFHVWWTNTGLETIDLIVDYAKQQLQLYKQIDILVLQHVVQRPIDNLTWYILVSKDNITRTFQSEVDTCRYLQEMAARYETK